MRDTALDKYTYTKKTHTHNGRQKLPSLFIIMEDTASDNVV